MLDRPSASDFVTAVWKIVRKTGSMSAPLLTDKLIPDHFPQTLSSAFDEGADRMLRDGVLKAVRETLSKGDNNDQTDMKGIDPSFAPFVEKLNRKSYYVESLEEFRSVSELIKTPSYLDDARKHLRRKGQETLAEAKLLDELYKAVIQRGAA